MKNRYGSIAVLTAVLFGAGMFSMAAGSARAEVKIRLPLPRLFLPAPPPLILIPGTYAYAAPDVDVDIVFYQGSWYRPHGGFWYISNGYNGPWQVLNAERVPRVLTGLPPDFRRIPPGRERMPYGHVKKNWKTWERERHWDDHGKKKRKERKEDGSDRGRGRDRDKKKHKGRD